MVSPRFRGRVGAGSAGVLCLLTACASEGFPPGGPEDLTPPVLVETDPADRAVNAAPDQAITLIFDEVIDDRQLGELPRLIRVNPDVPDFDFILDENVVTLAPQEPMAIGVTYTVTVLAGLGDRGGNATVQPRTIYFSTGGEQPITLSVVRATIVRDTVPAAGAFYRLEDAGTGLGYSAVADSQGRLELQAVAYGSYVATAWMETESPEGWQMTEESGARDTFELSLENRLHEAIYRIAVVDTTAPLVVSAETQGSRLLVVVTDDLLAVPAPGPDVVQLFQAAPGLPDDVAPDSLPVERVRGQRLAVESVEASGPTALRIVPARPLESGAIYRIELAGVENAAGIPGRPEGGRTFRARFEGPIDMPSEAIPWPGGPP